MELIFCSWQVLHVNTECWWSFHLQRPQKNFRGNLEIQFVLDPKKTGIKTKCPSKFNVLRLFKPMGLNFFWSLLKGNAGNVMTKERNWQHMYLGRDTGRSNGETLDTSLMFLNLLFFGCSVGTIPTQPSKWPMSESYHQGEVHLLSLISQEMFSLPSINHDFPAEVS